MFGFGNKKLRAELAEARELAEKQQIRGDFLWVDYQKLSEKYNSVQAELSAIKAADAARRARKAETDKLRRAGKKATRKATNKAAQA